MIAPEDQDALDAERGHRAIGLREARLREWYSLREEGEKAGDFNRLVHRLMGRRRQAAYRRRVFASGRSREMMRTWRANAARRMAAAGTLEKWLAHERKRSTARTRRYRVRWRDKLKARRFVAVVRTCAQCGREWSNVDVAGRKKFCSDACRTRSLYDRKNARRNSQRAAARSAA